MIDIVKAHGLIPIPVFNNEADLSINPKDIESKISSKTRIILIAHLFGATTQLKEIRKLKKKHPNILIVEDCAQSFKAPKDWIEHNWIDLSMISFGTIKTMSCFRGSLNFVKDTMLFNKMI